MQVAGLTPTNNAVSYYAINTQQQLVQQIPNGTNEAEAAGGSGNNNQQSINSANTIVSSADNTATPAATVTSPVNTDNALVSPSSFAVFYSNAAQTDKSHYLSPSQYAAISELTAPQSTNNLLISA